MPPKAKKVKKTKLRKPQPLPRSVQALLKYLGGSDVKVGGARGGQPAQLAPTSINIAISQQQAQQQSQAQQSVRARVAPKGEPIGKSPLAAVIPQQPIIVQQAPASTAETERKIQAQAKEAEIKQNEINRKFGLLEASQQQFRQAASAAYQDIKRDINRRVAGDANIFDARNLASKFTQRPIVEEQQFAGVKVGEEAETLTWTDITEEGSFQAGQYLENVTNPEMTPIERAKRGRRPLTEEMKRAREAEKRIAKEAAKELKASVRQPRATKKTTKTDISSLLEENVTTQNVLKSITPEQPNIIRRFPSAVISGRKPVSTVGAPDMATQIAMLTGGGAVATPQSQGRTIAELLGATRK